MSRRAALLAVLTLAACNSGGGSPSLRLRQPTGVALFHGYTDRHATELRPYVAIANGGQDELVLVDAVEDAAVASTIAIRPLSIPVPDPRPAKVVAASLGDGLPDLLVAVSSGATTLQLVKTWRTGGLSLPSVDDAHAVELDRPVEALIALPQVDAAGLVVPGRAWVVAALAPATGEGTDLAVVEYVRSTDATQPEVIAPSTLTAPAIQHLDFEVRSLGLDPSDVRYLYAASGDPIPAAGGVLGVAELSLAGGPGAFGVRGLDARAPTTLVAGFTLAERNVDQSGSYDQVLNLPDDATNTLGCSLVPVDVEACPISGFRHGATLAEPVKARRVYASLDEAHCGREQPIACGVVVLDPDSAPSPSFGHLLANPYLGASSESAAIGRSHDDAAEPSLPPISVPGTPEALVVIPPPRNPPDSNRAYQLAPFMTVSSTVRTRLTTGVLAIPSANGRVYLLDLARWELASDTYALRSSTAVGISAYYLGATSLPQIGFYLRTGATSAFALQSDVVGGKEALARDPAQTGLVSAFTLGYTPDDIWAVTYQGFLPGLDVARPAEVEAGPATGLLRVALQARTPAGGWTQVFRVHDPTYGVRVGDIVQLWTHGELNGAAEAQCPATQDSTDAVPIYPFEGKVLELTPPDAAHPGGSLVLEQPDAWVRSDGGYTRHDTTAQEYWTGSLGLHCQETLAALGTNGGYTAVPVRIRARGYDPAEPDPDHHREFVVAGVALGYVGRATENTQADAEGPSPRDYVLRTRDESALSCPLIPWPADPAAVSCDAACRQRCEDLVVARKARRLWNVSVRCAIGDTDCRTAYGMFDATVDPTATIPTLDPARVIQPTGPVMAFRLGVNSAGKVDPKGVQKELVRDTVVRFATRSGFKPSIRYGSAYSGGTGILPSGGVAFDRSFDPAWKKQGDGPRLFVPYLDGTLIDASPSHSNGTTTQLR